MIQLAYCTQILRLPICTALQLGSVNFNFTLKFSDLWFELIDSPSLSSNLCQFEIVFVFFVCFTSVLVFGRPTVFVRGTLVPSVASWATSATSHTLRRRPRDRTDDCFWMCISYIFLHCSKYLCQLCQCINCAVTMIYNIYYLKIDCRHILP